MGKLKLKDLKNIVANADSILENQIQNGIKRYKHNLVATFEEMKLLVIKNKSHHEDSVGFCKGIMACIEIIEGNKELTLTQEEIDLVKEGKENE